MDKPEEYNEETRVVAFPEVGEGVILLFRRKDCLTLRQRPDLGRGWFNDAADRMNEYDMEAMEIYLQVGGKIGTKPRPISLDELENVTIRDIALRILDALYLSVYGKTFIDYSAWVLGEMEKRKGELLDPKKDPASFLLNSTEQPSGSASSQQSSTN